MRAISRFYSIIKKNELRINKERMKKINGLIYDKEESIKILIINK